MMSWVRDAIMWRVRHVLRSPAERRAARRFRKVAEAPIPPEVIARHREAVRRGEINVVHLKRYDPFARDDPRTTAITEADERLLRGDKNKEEE